MSVVKSIKGLTPADWQALAIIGKKAAEYRGELEPGRRQPVDVLLRVQGYLDVFEDGKTTKSDKPSAELLLGFALSKLDEAGRKAVHDAFAEAIKAGELPEVADGWKASAAAWISGVTKREKIPRKGSTKGAFTVGQVDLGALTPVVSSSLAKASRAISLED